MDKPVSLLEFAYGKIKAKILAGELPPGHKLSAKTISESLNISQTPVKEAINRLVAEGFVQSNPRRGHQVSRLSISDVKDMMDVRLMMECFAAKSAVQNAPHHPEIMRRMQELLIPYSHASSLDYLQVSAIEQEFHNLYIQLSENKRLIKLYQTDWSVSLLYYLYSITNHPLSSLDHLFTSHQMIYDFILAQDTHGLEKLLSQTMKSVMALLTDLILADKTGAFLKE